MHNQKHIKRKTLLVYIILFVLGLGIVAQIVYTQIFEYKIWTLENYNITRLSPIDASRGNIYSDNYSLLATSIPEYELRWDASVVNDLIFNEKIHLLSKELSNLFNDKSAKEYEDFFRNERNKNSRYALLKRKVNYNQLKLIKKFPIFNQGKFKSGFIYHQKNKRKKPFKELASRTIGYDRKESKSVGLEGAFNLYLKGKNGEKLEQRLAGNVWMPIRSLDSKPGKDLLTTIDIRYQDISNKALSESILYHDANHGCAILMEVKSGAVKAIVNLKNTGKGYCVENYNYAIAESSEPGSTFKLASIIAGLEDGYLKVDDSVDTENGVFKFYDRKMRDAKKGGYGIISLNQSFEKSSNVGISKLIYNHYKNSPEKFVNRLYSMGLNESLNISISGESKPNIRHPKNKHLWSGTTLPWMSIGYGIELTPLQTLSFYAAIANEGMRMKPYFVSSILENGIKTKTFKPEVINPSICSKSTIEVVKSMLEGVVKNGTAKNIISDNYNIAGKTGTNWIDYANKLEDDRPKYQASFVGYFPSDKPIYACIVVVNDPKINGSYGGEVAAPVFKKISDYVFISDLKLQNENITKPIIPKVNSYGSYEDLNIIFDHLSLNDSNISCKNEYSLAYYSDGEIRYESTEIKKNLKENIMPNMIGVSFKDALFMLENYGLIVSVQGTGMINYQSIQKGEKIRKGQEVLLKSI